MKRSRGFTLLELLVVIIIIVLLAGVAVAMMNTFFRGQGVRQGAMIITSTFASAKQSAADKRAIHFIVFWNEPDGGKLEIHMDANGDGVYQGDMLTATPDPDPAVEGKVVDLPKYCDFVLPNPQGWIGFNPSGYCVFNPGFAEVQAGIFDGTMAGGSPSAIGDLIIQVQNKPYKVCMDIDRAAGKIRRHHFLAQ